MALAYADIGATVTDEVFQDKIIGALEAQCIIVNAEDPNTANHPLRLALLGRVVTQPEKYAKLFAPLIASVAPINGLTGVGLATDPNILSGVQNVWNAVATLGL